MPGDMIFTGEHYSTKQFQFIFMWEHQDADGIAKEFGDMQDEKIGLDAPVVSSFAGVAAIPECKFGGRSSKKPTARVKKRHARQVEEQNPAVEQRRTQADRKRPRRGRRARLNSSDDVIGS